MGSALYCGKYNKSLEKLSPKISQIQQFVEEGVILLDFTSSFARIFSLESLESSFRDLFPQEMSLHSPTDSRSVLRVTCIKIDKTSAQLVLVEVVFITHETRINLFPVNHPLTNQMKVGPIVLRTSFPTTSSNLSCLLGWIIDHRDDEPYTKGKSLFKYLKALFKLQP